MVTGSDEVDLDYTTAGEEPYSMHEYSAISKTAKPQKIILQNFKAVL